jgi:type IV secretory pathway component VirB8
MRPRRVLHQWLSVIFLFLTILQAAAIEAAAPLQKIVFVFAGFNKRSGFIFTAKDMRFFEEQV